MSKKLDEKSSQFVHSVKVPRVYKVASKIFKEVSSNGGSLKELLYKTEHVNKKVTLKLVTLTLKNYNKVDYLLKKTQLLKQEARLDPWLAGVLVTELLFGKKQFKSDCKPIKTVLSYKKRLNKLISSSKEEKVTESCSRVVPRYVRVNTLKATPDEVIKRFREEGWNLVPKCQDYQEYLRIVETLQQDNFVRDFHLKYLLVFPPNTEFFKHQLYQDGVIMLQDKASCLAAHLLAPTPGAVVLDACAAPGMKTTCLSALTKNKGKLFAAEQNEARFNTLTELVKSAGCTNVQTIHTDSLALSVDTHDWCKQVEFILVDPTCSGSGMKDRINIFSDDKIEAKRLRKLAAFQYKLLHHALTSFTSVSRVVYSTCSTYTDENECVVERAINDVEINSKFKLVTAMEDWQHRGSSDFECGPFCLVSDPKTDFTNGFFVAVFERKNDREMKEVGEEEIVERVKKKKKRLEVMEDTTLEETKNGKKLAKRHKRGNLGRSENKNGGSDVTGKKRKKLKSQKLKENGH